MAEATRYVTRSWLGRASYQIGAAAVATGLVTALVAVLATVMIAHSGRPGGVHARAAGAAHGPADALPQYTWHPGYHGVPASEPDQPGHRHAARPRHAAPPPAGSPGHAPASSSRKPALAPWQRLAVREGAPAWAVRMIG